jgi:ABC-2 type transport system ATP-binding protein
MAEVFGLLAARGVNVLAASVGQPSLDDVFLRETGRSLRDAGPAGSRPAETAAGQEVAA